MGFLCMTRQDYEDKTLNELIEQLNEENDCIHSRESMKDMAIHFIKEDDMGVAKHIIEGIDNSAEWFDWDVSMGTMDEVSPIVWKIDIYHLIEE